MITKAKIIGDNIEYATYAKQADGIKRGDQLFVMSRSELVNFVVNPKRWKDGYKEDHDDTTATIWGSLIDCMVLTPDRFEDRYAVAPEEYRDEKTGNLKPWNNNANVCKEWNAEQGDRTVLKKSVKVEADAAVAAIKADPDVSKLLDCSNRQVMCLADWEIGGVYVCTLRVLIDLAPERADKSYGRLLGDFKTARNGNPAKWPYVVEDCGYDVQAALSLDIYNAAAKEERDGWVFPIQENVKPYHVVKPMPALSTEFLKYGRAKYEAALTLYSKCVATGIWPSFPTGNNLLVGPTQIISPDALFSYRQSAGQVA